MLRARDDKSKDDRKQQILDCAEQILQQEGLPSLSISGVAKKAGLAVGTIYLYFPRKEDIIAQLTLKSREMLLEWFKRAAALAEEPLDKIAEVLRAYYAFYKRHAFYHQLVSFYETNAGLEEPEELLNASKGITDLVVSILREGKGRNSIRHDIDERTFAFLLWGSAVGVIQLIEVKAAILAEQTKDTQDAFYESYIQLIINGLKIK